MDFGPFALITTSFPRHRDDASGHFVLAHAIELAASGLDVTVFALGAPDTSRPAPSVGADVSPRSGDLEVEWLGGADAFGWPGAVQRLRARPLRLVPATAACMRGARRLRAFDRVAAHWIVPCAFPIAWSARPRELTVWAHGTDVRMLTALPVLARVVIRALIDVGARFVFVAEALRRDLAAVLGPRDREALLARSEVRPAPIHVPDRASLPDPRAPGAPAYAVWIGRQAPEKRPELAMRAASRTGVELMMIGIDGMGLGSLPRSETLRWLAHANALVSTSTREGSPTVVREARALGVPVIAFSAGDIEARAKHDPGIVLVHSEEELERELARIVPRKL